MIFQPASRFWAFQGIETSIFIVLALVLVAFAYRRSSPRRMRCVRHVDVRVGTRRREPHIRHENEHHHGPLDARTNRTLRVDDHGGGRDEREGVEEQAWRQPQRPVEDHRHQDRTRDDLPCRRTCARRMAQRPPRASTTQPVPTR